MHKRTISDERDDSNSRDGNIAFKEENVDIPDSSKFLDQYSMQMQDQPKNYESGY